VNDYSLMQKAEIHDRFMSSGKFDKNTNLNLGTIICIRTSPIQLQEVLILLSKGLANAYLNGANGRLKYEFDPKGSKLMITLWGTINFQCELMSSLKNIRNIIRK